MKTRVFLITAKTNLHVGNESGGEFSIIDKAIQRDPLTNLPCINSSSLKGAIKEFCVHNTNVDVKEVFGSDVDPKTGKAQPDTSKGQAIFFDAKILYLPQQGAPAEAQEKNMMYHYVTTDKIKQMMVERVNLFDKEGGFTVNDIKSPQGVMVRNVGDKQFETCCHEDNLPIIARNVLENGESKNLWYEQVLPAETVLYTIIREESEDLLNALNTKVVQIGAGATIGYGYCKFECIYSKEG